MKKWTLCLQTLFISILHWIGDFRLNAKTKKQNLKLKNCGQEQLQNHFSRELKGISTRFLVQGCPNCQWAQDPLGCWAGWLLSGALREHSVHSDGAPSPSTFLILSCFFLLCFSPNNIPRDNVHFKGDLYKVFLFSVLNLKLSI